MIHNMLKLVFLLLIASAVNASTIKDKADTPIGSSPRPFPEGFLFGAATAAYQTEGAWNTEGRTNSIWDHLLHNVNPCFNDECSNGDEACKSYQYWQRDIQMIKDAGLDFYRFSVSWSRILPNGFANQVNQVAIDHYNQIIDALLENNIIPIVTIYHWDLPQKLQELGGFTNVEIENWLRDFARILFENFGDRVKHWITINEPSLICTSGYGTDSMAPQLNSSGIGDYMCSRNLLLAHSNVYHMYDREFRPSQGGVIGIAMSARWYEAESLEHEDGAEDYREFSFGVWANPIFGSGNWPQRMRDRVDRNSATEGFPRSRLPNFTEEQITRLKGSSDFFGLNHYTTDMIYRNSSVDSLYTVPSQERDIYAINYQPAEWQKDATSWTWDLPWGFYNLLIDVKNKYNNPKVWIFENGYAERIPVGQSDLNDVRRVNYIRGYLGALLDAVEEGSNVIGYTVWSLLDNYNWRDGYKMRFGLFETDMASEERTRTPRRSAYVYKHIIQNRALDLSYEPDMSQPL